MKMSVKRELEDLFIDMKFNQDFNPNRTRRTKPKSTHTPHGQIRTMWKDVCDCLDDRCIGCHFPCKQCSNTKCGKDCRRNRHDHTAEMQIENHNVTVLNVNLRAKI